MTTGELINELKKLPDDIEIVVSDHKDTVDRGISDVLWVAETKQAFLITV